MNDWVILIKEPLLYILSSKIESFEVVRKKNLKNIHQKFKPPPRTIPYTQRHRHTHPDIVYSVNQTKQK
ncbi:hypothetical protein BLA29_000428 [Euroglyphus maynei]|uniref:Uncharacterized protein n=1 Tax=Euroglyphus maynei TaxID=6958 RepID=A0A1Y3BHG0_EURMA|nr:hypothetical protein BLA29_000428 [Euroglyphus maynei]